jgi:hypothetical protein
MGSVMSSFLVRYVILAWDHVISSRIIYTRIHALNFALCGEPYAWTRAIISATFLPSFIKLGPEWNKIPSLWNPVRHLAFCPLTVTRISPPKTHDSPSVVTASLPARRPIVSAGLLREAQPRQDYSTLCLQRSSNGFDDIDRNGKADTLFLCAPVKAVESIPTMRLPESTSGPLLPGLMG